MPFDGSNEFVRKKEKKIFYLFQVINVPCIFTHSIAIEKWIALSWNKKAKTTENESMYRMPRILVFYFIGVVFALCEKKQKNDEETIVGAGQSYICMLVYMAMVMMICICQFCFEVYNSFF